MFMNNKPQLYVFDLDGTITNQSKIIPPILQNTLRALQRGGALCTMATGNAFVQIVRNFQGQFIPNAPMILENGGRIVDVYESSYQEFPIDQHTQSIIPTIIADNTVDFLGFYGSIKEDYMMYSPYELTSNSLVRILGQQTRSVEQFMEWVAEYSPVRIVFSLDSEPIVLPNHFSATLAPNVGTYEITAPNINKGSSLQWLVEMLDIPWERVAVFGNGYNDISLFKTQASTKVYVGNECPELEQLATHRVINAYEVELFLRKYV